MSPETTKPLRLADLPQNAPTPVLLIPQADTLAAMADRLDLSALRKVRLEGALHPGPGRDWRFEGRLGATVVQPCRVTTDPVTTRIDEPVLRRFVADWHPPEGDEIEMDDEADLEEPLPATIDPAALLEEALSLAVPAYPRSEGAEAIDLTAAPPGAEPIDDEAARPFAGLAALRARMEDGKD
jgi:uncharacterized metal-binding protein YceD (DUF177 family)